ncbi:cas scaffolding protein family member 4 [Esox lucius]|uniref:Cas scaffold protein family member 4 n=1 Tax=Esox lucius TaxID=8010 RepID=A0A3P9A2G1_ESOLU|nr:cas scaffolding protein family member 4 [Esox lucius]
MEQKVLAKALYDNTAECSDELGFRRGDILTVLQQEVDSSCGWWICSLYGRHGLAPANRLQLLPRDPLPTQTQDKDTGSSAGVVDPASSHNSDSDGPGNIYQIPSVPRHTLSSSPTYEHMAPVYKVPSRDRIYKVPSKACHSPARSPCYSYPLKHSPDGAETSLSCVISGSSEGGKVYDVPRHGRTSLFPPSNRRHCSPSQDYVYPVPAAVTPDPNYDIPVPSVLSSSIPLPVPFTPPAKSSNTLGLPQTQPSAYKTLPNPHKSDWIYDVPNSPERPGGQPGYYTTLPSAGQTSKYTTLPPGGQPGYYTSVPSKALSSVRQFDDTLPTRGCSGPSNGSTPSVYDIPKPSVSPLEQFSVSVPHRGHHIPLECRGDSGPTYDHPNPRGCLQRGRLGMAAGALGARPGISDALLQEEEDDEERGRRTTYLSGANDKQRISTASTSSSSSSSSCDSLALCSSSPEMQREVCLSQEEACKTLLFLQQEVCRQVPRLMDFVSSRWRSSEHLEKHLPEIRSAAEGVASSVTSFLTFALDVKGNTQRLTDSNLQVSLRRQLSVVEDSGLILQQAVRSLGTSGWSLPLLVQDPAQNHTPDQLDRLIMVTRTVPEDIKRLVSIVNANAKLLFRPTEQKETDRPDVINNSSITTSNTGTRNMSTSNTGTSNISTSNISTSNMTTSNTGTRNMSTSNIRTSNTGTSKMSTSNISTSNIRTRNAGISNISTRKINISNNSTSIAGSENKILVKSNQEQNDSGTDDNDYVQLQTKKEFEKQQIKGLRKETQPKIPSIKPKEDHKGSISEPCVVSLDSPRRSSEPLSQKKLNSSEHVEVPRKISEPLVSAGKTLRSDSRVPDASQKPQVGSESPKIPCVAQVDRPKRQPPLSEHCRLYFGALQKALVVFVTSLLEGQPPEKFISHSKLVIMVGQRLVDTLCQEAHRPARETKGGEPGPGSGSESGPSQNQVLLCKTNHLCALLKQLAVATKKAALHYPEQQALQEVQDFAKELAQRAQQFRISMDL